MSYVRAIIVVSAAVAAVANEKAKETTGHDADLKAWTVPLSPTGALPATHYWCNWQFTPGWWDKLNVLFAAQPPAERTKIQVFKLSDPDPAIATPRPEEILAQLGLKTIQPAV